MAEVLRATHETPVGEVAKKHGVAEQTIDVWRQRVGRLRAADVERLRRLENLLAERDLEIEVMKEVARNNW